MVIKCHFSPRGGPNGGRPVPVPLGTNLCSDKLNIREGGQLGPVPSRTTAENSIDSDVQRGTVPDIIHYYLGEQRGSVPGGGLAGNCIDSGVQRGTVPGIIHYYLGEQRGSVPGRGPTGVQLGTAARIPYAGSPEGVQLGTVPSGYDTMEWSNGDFPKTHRMLGVQLSTVPTTNPEGVQL
eukprot:752895-Karenia_brevis.AAC.1